MQLHQELGQRVDNAKEVHDASVASLTDLYNKCHNKFLEQTARMERSEAMLMKLQKAFEESDKGGGSKSHHGLIDPKFMQPSVFSGGLGFVAWKDSIKDYAESKRRGWKAVLDRVDSRHEKINDDFDIEGVNEPGSVPPSSGWFSETKDLYAILKRHTGEGSQTRRVLEGVPSENGLEVWRQLQLFYAQRQDKRPVGFEGGRSWGASGGQSKDW